MRDGAARVIHQEAAFLPYQIKIVIIVNTLTIDLDTGNHELTSHDAAFPGRQQRRFRTTVNAIVKLSMQYPILLEVDERSFRKERVSDNRTNFKDANREINEALADGDRLKNARQNE